MKQRILAVGLVLALMFSASACSSVYEEEYSYAVPYEEETNAADSGSGVEIRNYSQLKNVISSMVNNLSTRGELRFYNYDGSVGDDMAAVCYEVRTQTPVGAYAVENLDYELSRIVSYYTVQVSISYRYTAEEMARVKSINGISTLKNYLRDAVTSYTEEMVLKVYSSTVNENYITDVIESVALTQPLMVTPMPQVYVESYPNEGVNRIYKICLDYDLDRTAIEQRTQLLLAALDQAGSEISAGDSAGLALASARYLSARCLTLAEQEAGQHRTSYDALVEGQAGSQGIALGYMALCAHLGLECQVVRGSYGTMGVEAHYWNQLTLDGANYHVDVSRMAAAGEAAVFLLSDEQAWGEYMWAYEDYPDCNGPLTYALVSGISPEEEELTGETESIQPDSSREIPAETEDAVPAETTEISPKSEPRADMTG